MAIARVSSKGQITLPSAARRKLGIKLNSRVEIEVRDNEIAVRPVKSISEVYGALSEYAKGKSADWETIRAETMRAVAEEVVNEDRQ
ncbi:MAG: AbrB/MazE/SpoVT family DNA-binding domain-containing protein [Armatimonadota bacterium]|nr:AbrB/MazE/SpoVT family DNA-binding domain-containing protein [Armatimonadota bacterium]